MPVFETILAIIAAFTGGATVFQGWKAANRDGQALALSKSLALGPTRVQSEYDRHYNRMGEKFAMGDDTANNSLSNILNNMLQQQLMDSLYALLNDESGAALLGRLVSTSDNARNGTIRVLGDQYQRLAIAAPIARSPQVDAFCDVCHSGIYGTRYKCKICPDYDECEQCYKTTGYHAGHAFYAL